VAADDEVAVAFAAGDGRAMSEAMINIRVALQRATQAGAVAPAIARRLMRAAKSMYFPERTWANLWRRTAPWLAARERAKLQRYLDDTRPDIKREDARLLLRRLAEDWD